MARKLNTDKTISLRCPKCEKGGKKVWMEKNEKGFFFCHQCGSKWTYEQAQNKYKEFGLGKRT